MNIKVLGYMNVSPSNVNSYLSQGWEFMMLPALQYKDGSYAYQMIKRG